MQSRLCDALRAAQSNPAAAAGGLCAVAMVAPICANGLKLTVRFLSSLSTSKKHGRIDGYNKLQEGDDAGERNTEYAALVDSYYDLATEFYEWGWGACFHFADRRGSESFAQCPCGVRSVVSARGEEAASAGLFRANPAGTAALVT